MVYIVWRRTYYSSGNKSSGRKITSGTKEIECDYGIGETTHTHNRLQKKKNTERKKQTFLSKRNLFKTNKYAKLSIYSV